MATETDEQKQEEETRFREAMMLRYQPKAGRADRSQTNIPGVNPVNREEQ